MNFELVYFEDTNQLVIHYATVHHRFGREYILFFGGARGVMVIVVEMDSVIRVKILDETTCISHSTNSLGKGMNPIILPPAMGK